MDTTPYSDSMARARQKFSAKGHIFGEWNPWQEGSGFVAVCDRCGGKLTISGDPKMMVIGTDPYLSLDICPGDDPELMKQISDAWAATLTRIYNLILSWPLPDEQEEQGNASDK